MTLEGLIHIIAADNCRCPKNAVEHHLDCPYYIVRDACRRVVPLAFEMLAKIAGKSQWIFLGAKERRPMEVAKGIREIADELKQSIGKP